MKIDAPASFKAARCSRSGAVFVILLLTTCAVSNLAMRPLMEAFQPDDTGAYLVFAAVGMLVAQFALFAIWSVLGPGSGTLRLGIGSAAALLLFGCWIMGSFLAFRFAGMQRVREFWMDEIILALACLPTLLVSIQLPLWVLKIWFRWRIERDDDPNGTARPGGMSVRGIMLATAAVGVAITMTQLAGDRVGFLTRLLLSAGIAMLAILLFVVPILPLMLLGVHPLRNLMIAGASLAGATIVMLAGAMFAFGWLPSGLDALNTVSIITGVTAPLVSALLLVRQLGYRLNWTSAVSQPGRRQKGPLRFGSS